MVKQLPFILLACFALTQSWKFYTRRSTPVFRASSTPTSMPVRVDIDRALDPPRRVVTALPRIAVHPSLPALYSREHLKSGKKVTRRGAARNLLGFRAKNGLEQRNRKKSQASPGHWRRHGRQVDKNSGHRDAYGLFGP